MSKLSKQLVLILGVLVIASMLLASCAPAATPTEAPAAEQPAAEQPAAEQPAAEQPAEEQPAAEQPAEEQPAEEQPAAEAPAFETILIPFVGPLTGPDGYDGVNSSKAAELAIKQANDKGGVCGGIKLEFEAHDTKSDPKEGANIATLLCNKPNVLGATADYNSSVTLAEGPVFNECKISQVVYYAAAPDIPKKSGPYTFRIYPPGQNMSYYIADYIINTEGKKKIAVLYENTDYGVGLYEAFVAKAKELGGEIVAEEAVLKDQTDLSAVISKFKAANPEALVGLIQYQVAAYFAMQSKDLDFNLPMWGSDGLFSPELWNLAGEAATGYATVAAYSLESTDPIVADFVKAFREAYGEDPTNSAGYAYDATVAIINGLNGSNCAGREALQQWLKANLTGMVGVTGAVALDEYNDRAFAPGMYTPIQLVDGKWVIIQ